MPNQTILELGCGQGLFTRQLFRVSRGENPITAVTFDADDIHLENLPASVELLKTSSEELLWRLYPRNHSG
jgi:phospholipid N-methyltransferase